MKAALLALSKEDQNSLLRLLKFVTHLSYWEMWYTLYWLNLLQVKMMKLRITQGEQCHPQGELPDPASLVQD